METSGGSTSTRDVVILGAGYAGVMAANRLLSSLSASERDQVRVTVVNAQDRFVERIRLHELLAGTVSDVTRPLQEMLHPDAHLIVASAHLIEPERNVVQLTSAAGAREIAYTELVYAVGSSSAASVPGAREHALFVADHDRATTAATTIAALPASRTVVVVGGGLTAVETASEIAEHRADLRVSLLVGSGLLPGFGSGARRAVERALRRLGVEIVSDALVRSVHDGELTLETGRVITFDACVWAAGFGVPDLAAKSGLAVDDIGRLRVDEDLTSVTAANIVGAGDGVVLPDANGAHLRMGCAVALPLGGHAAETVLHHLRGTRAAPASIGMVVQCLSLGRRRGVVQLVSADDRPRPVHLAGFAAAWFKEYLCKLTIRGPQQERTKPGAYRAPAGPARERSVQRG